MDIKRPAQILIQDRLEKGKVLVLYGPRRVGKTFLLDKVIKNKDLKKEKIVFLKGDNRLVQENLASLNPQQMISFIGQNTSLLIIDEAQKVKNIGDALKLLVDEFPNLKIIASGSASFDLAQKIGEPLTGRKKTILLYPVSAKELILTKNQRFYQEIFEQHLIYGGYPEVFKQNSLKQKQEYLSELTNAYLFKDILELESIKNSQKLRDLLGLIAFQIGKQVSLNELGNNLDLNKETVARYLDLLEKSFVLIKARGFSRNLRKEIYKSSRWYFWDNGVRNAIINNFNPLSLRNDVGQLWENYVIVERLKKQSYANILSNNYFWRTYDQKEIDWVEERQGKLFGYEIKWQKTKKVQPPKGWLETYPHAQYQLITRQNYLDFIT